MKKKFEAEVHFTKKFKLELDLHVDTGLTLDEIVEDLDYQTQVKFRNVQAGCNDGDVDVTWRGSDVKVISIKLVEEVEIVR